MKKVSKTGIFLLVVMFLVSISLFGCETETETGVEDPDGTEKEVLVMGTNADFPPFEFIDDDNEIVGFDIDLANEIADILDMELEIENMDFDGLVSAVATGKVDIAVAAMTIREDRLETVNFSEPYFDAGQVIVVRDDYDEIAGEDDLLDKNIAAQLGTTGQFALEDLEVPDDQVTLFPKVTEVFMELTQGKVDAVVIDEPVALRYIEQQEGLKLVGDKFTDEVFGIAVAKENTELLDQINEALEEIKESGKYDELLEEWF